MTIEVKLTETAAKSTSFDYYRRGMPYTFFSGKKKFQIVVKMKDAPGALAGVLEVIRKHVNPTSLEFHRSGKGEPIFSCFAEPLLPKETPESLEKLIRSSRTAIDVWVAEGSDGLLVDSYFRGIKTENGERVMLFRWDGINQMFDRLVEVFGSGGEVMLYNDGASIGESNLREILERIGKDAVARNMPMVLRMLTASGWGDASLEVSKSSGVTAVRIKDCFECSSRRKTRHNCAFMRGLLTGSAKAILGPAVTYEETKCRLKGDGYCEFSPVLGGTQRNALP